jgi:hypothetical protein
MARAFNIDRDMGRLDPPVADERGAVHDGIDRRGTSEYSVRDVPADVGSTAREADHLMSTRL